MLPASFEFRRAITRNTKVLVKATLTLADGTVRELAGDDLMMGSATFADSTSSAGSFDVGAAIIGRMSMSLNNYDGRFDDYDFEGSEIVPYVGVRLGDGAVEWLRKGVYGVEQPETYGNVIGVTALDNMRRLERPYSEVATEYPATLGTIARDICARCGVTLATPAFANSSFVVDERPDDSSLTCIAALAYVAQASGNWARCDEWGRMRLDWYDTSAYEAEDWLDGDRFDGATPYESGDTASGGDFVVYGGGDTADGGGFGGRQWAHVFALASLTVATDDVVVTGVRVTAQDGDGGQEGETALFGSEGYVLDLPSNPLVRRGAAQAVAAQVGGRVVGMRFRPFDISALGDPTIEAGDPIVITDAKQRQYRSYITTTTYKAGAYQAIACNAQTPGRNKASSYSALTQAIVRLRRADKAERDARVLAIGNLARQLAESSGLFMTEEPQQDGSTIYYMHDRPTLRESAIVWKLTANALGISTDGGRTYPYGLDVNGDAILNRIYAIGINADYINAGALTIRDGENTVFSADSDTGIVYFRDRYGNYIDSRSGFRLAASAGMGDRTVQDVIDGVDATVTGVDVEYAQNQSRTDPPASGWATDAPQWREGWYIWSRTATTTAGGTTYSDPVCISGRDGSSGTNASTLYLYRRAQSAPARPSATLTYAFATGELSGDLGGWSRGIPDGEGTCWVTVASAISNGDTDTIAPSEWSDPVELAAGGVDGLNQATIYLHKRASPWRPRGGTLAAPAEASVSGTTATVRGTVSGTTLALDSGAPAPPSDTLTYTFASGTLAGNLAGWSRGVPDGDAPCWVTTAVAISSEATDSIAPTEWAEVVKLVEDGEGSTVDAVEYAVGTGGTRAPETGWQATVPVVAPGMWLWSRTTYSEGDVSYTCAYMGTDGRDGSSVAIRSVTKEGGTTTLVIASSDGTTRTLTIEDGTDGDDGTPGAAGYVHVAWANSADGRQGFSTHDSEGKTHIGVYTDNTAADSTNPADYSWSLIKGADGRGISATAIAYGISDSGTEQPKGWTATIPTVAQGRWLWIRTTHTYTDDTTSTTYGKSYVGTDGQDGRSVYVQSSTKDDGVTTIVLTDGTSTNTITIADGTDGDDGRPGKDGLTGYVHVAWANSDDGSQGFSTHDSANKTHIGVYTDNESADSTDYRDYSWSKIKGADGRGISSTAISYAASASGTTQPTDWQQSVPAVAKGQWLWVRTTHTYTDKSTSTSYAKSYVGTDGQDGKSVYVLSSTKRGGTTTTVLTDGTRQTTITIEDGADGENGRPGADGLTGYVHVAWATSEDGSQGFSTSVSAGKTYIGVYTDNESSDSKDYRDYSWSKIKGETGTGVSAVVEQYYLSTSSTAQEGGSWSTAQPEWSEGRHIWTRSAVTWTDGTTTYTAPVLAKAVNGANESAEEAKGEVTKLDTGLDQQGIFNRLTNDGETQGIYLQDRKVYLNASYVKAGELDAGLIRTGSLVVARDGVTMLSANMDTGAVSVNSDCVTLGSESLTSTVRAMRAQFGTCATAAATKAKVVACEGFSLRTGATVSVRFDNANAASGPTLNVNATGAKPIRLNGAAIPEGAWWKAGETVTFIYDGAGWVVTDGAAMAQAVTNKGDIATLAQSAEQFALSLESHAETLTQLKATYCTCPTAAATQAKEADCEGFALRKGAVVSVRFSYANSAASPTLNVNATGAKPIRLNGAAIPEANWWKAGDLVTLVYDGAAWSMVDGSTLSQLKSTNDSVAALVVRADSLDATVKGVQATYGTCTTAAATQVKEVTISGFRKYVGQTVTVRFTYANTATSPKLSVKNSEGTEVATGYIYVNNAQMASDQYWGAQGVLTLVWDGTYWRVGDGYTMSSIKALKDSISLSVSNASLGSKASITLSVAGSTTTKDIDLTGVRNAFRDDDSAIAISAGTVTFNAGTFVMNAANASIDSTGRITSRSSDGDWVKVAGGSLAVGFASSGTDYTGGIVEFIGNDEALVPISDRGIVIYGQSKSGARVEVRRSGITANGATAISGTTTINNVLRITSSNIQPYNGSSFVSGITRDIYMPDGNHYIEVTRGIVTGYKAAIS